MSSKESSGWEQQIVSGNSVWWLIAAATLILAAIVAVVLSKKGNKKVEAPVVTQKKTKKQEPKKKETKAKKSQDKKEEHPLLLGQLRSHEDEVLSMAFSGSGTTFASLAEDRTVRVCAVKDMTAKDVKPHRINLEDHGDLLALTKDGNSLLLVLPLAARSVRIFSLQKGADGRVQATKVKDIPTKHKSEIKSLCVANNSKFFLTCSESDTLVQIWSMQGDELASLDTKKIKHNMACISPDSRFFTVGTFTGDVKVYEVATQKGSDTWSFNGIKQAMTLINGHSSSVNDICFSGDTKKLVTCSKDGTWKMWNIDVRYAQKEDPKVVYSVKLGKPVEHVAIAPDASVVVASVEGQLHFYSAADGSPLHTVTRAHNAGERIKSLQWSPDSRFVASAAVRDRTIRLWKNPLKA